MQTAHELFLHELSDMLDAERKILDTLETQSEETTNPALKQALEKHHEQTQGQIERLEQAFEILGEEAEDTECAGIKGLREEHDTMKEEDPSEDILDVFNVAAAIKTEHYEISAYEALIRLSDMMEHKKVTRLLQQNLREEEQTLKKMNSLANKVQPENMGMEEEESEEEEAEEVSSSSSRGRGTRGRTQRSSSRRRAA